MDPDADPDPAIFVRMPLIRIRNTASGGQVCRRRLQEHHQIPELVPLDPVRESKDAVKFSTWRAAYRSEVIYRKCCEEVDILGDIKNYSYFSWREAGAVDRQFGIFKYLSSLRDSKVRYTLSLVGEESSR
jgi:hypothetical protein